jgi:pimeloyl-ACP methyl ester carboxylesterase
MAATQFFSLPDGRRIAYCEYGDPAGEPLFYLHGWPGSRFEGELVHETARQHGLRIIAPDRPGIGLSTRFPGRTLLSDAQDLANLADHLDWDRFGVLGWSRGCAPALACAYALENRLTYTLLVSASTHLVEYPEGAALLPQAERRILSLGQNSPLLLRLRFKFMQFALRLSPGSYFRLQAEASPPVEQQLLADKTLRRRLIASQHEALHQGARGMVREANLLYQDWGFRLPMIPGRVHVFQGEDDPFVPPAFARHLSEQLPEGILHLYPEAGHFLLLSCQEELFSTARAELNPEIPTLPL